MTINTLEILMIIFLLLSVFFMGCAFLLIITKDKLFIPLWILVLCFMLGAICCSEAKYQIVEKNIENGYSVYVNGIKAESDKISNIRNFDIEIDEEEKCVLLTTQ